MDGEQPQTTLKACHHRRGVHQAQVTRVGLKVTKMLALGLDKYRPAEIENQLVVIRQQIAPYRTLQEQIMMHFDQGEEELEEERIAADKFEDSVSSWTEELTRMKAESGLYQELNRLLRQVRATAREEPDLHTSRKAADHSITYSSLQRDELAIIHMHADLAGLYQEVDDSLRSLERAVADALPTARDKTLPPSGSYSEDRSDRRRESNITHRLPRIELPTFTGNFLEWHAFWAIFRRNVHDNPDLQEEEKVAYLHKAIQDTSRPSMIDTASAVPGCYETYLASLKERYDRKRRIHSHHTKAFFSCPPCRDASAKELSRVHNTLSNAVSKLEFTRQFTAESLATSFAEGLLPPDLWEQWNLAEGDAQVVPNIHKLLKFLEQRSNLAQLRAMDLGNQATPTDRTRPAKRSERPMPQEDYSTRRHAYSTGQGRTCELCRGEQHPLFFCDKFKSMTVDDRSDYVRSKRLCCNCLSHGHGTRDCISLYKCRRCGKAHHTILHRDTPSTDQTEYTEDKVSAATEVIGGVVRSPGVFISTLMLTAHAPNQRAAPVRAMLDSGSTISLIKASVVRRLKLPTHQTSINIVGVQGATTGRSTAIARFTLKSNQVRDAHLDMTAYVVDTVAGTLPDKRSKHSWEFLDTIMLGDPNFNIPSKVELILGNDVLDDIMRTGTLRGEQEFPRASNTIFGWVVEGRMEERELPTNGPDNPTGFCSHITRATAAEENLSAQQEANALLRTFWEVEEVPQTQPRWTPEEAEAVDHFHLTHRITPDGRFQVALPRQTSARTLGSSRGRALKRFTTNEASLLRRGRWVQFQTVVQEYLDLGHAEPVPTTEIDSPTDATYYMPMHAVLKASSTTTKLRVVFDASAATSTGVSLNDTLLVGPTMQRTLTDILLRFRTHRVGVSADISKMYRAIKLAQEEKDYHRFLWRRLPTEPVTDHRMRRVTFGVAASPFVATKVLHQIATNAMDHSPEAAARILDSFYVDDFLSGAATHEQATTLCDQVMALLDAHGLELRKWRSNSPGFLASIPEQLLETSKEPDVYGPGSYHKTLGIHWDSGADHFFVSTSQLRLPATLTKRLLASDIHSTFDVMGWLTPVTLQMKVLLQELWEEKLDWDEVVSSRTQKEWSEWRKELPGLASRAIPRYYFRKDSDPCNIQLHGFSDASIKAYAAVVYVRAEYPGKPPTVTLVTAKSRVAPLKPLTIPKLELCGAHLLARVMKTVMEALNIPISQVMCWTDSTIVLNWLDGSARRYRTYVANRIVSTLESIPVGHWSHVPTISNPADCASRGIQPQELRNHPLWWTGPEWLATDPINLPPQPAKDQEELERKTVTHTRLEQPLWLIDRFSTHQRLRRVAAWILRFTRQARPSDSERVAPTTLGVQELEDAELLLCKQSQERAFGHGPGKGDTHPDLKALNSFYDNTNLLRVGGRLGNSKLDYSQLHPVILHGRDQLTRLIIKQLHQETGHAGPNLLLARLSRQYYVLRAMRQVKTICSSCIKCRRLQAKPTEQLMGQLPSHRVRPGSTFEVVGVDYAGPLLTKYAHVRKPTVVKTYVCVFICMTSRAIHLETVSDLTTGAFLGCLERFVARRGRPRVVYSDNGGNFVGAARQLEETLIPTQEARDEVHDHCARKGIEWKFSPERAPHFGGMWEAGVKAMKFHLRRIMGDTRLTYEELTTVLCNIEAMLNSRPLVRLHSHSEEGIDVLTPGHFLVGKPLEALPSRTPQRTTSLTRRWNLCQELTSHFWKRWSEEYIRQLQHRNRWTQTRTNIKVNDVVLMRDDGLFIHDWPLARVLKTFPGQDGLVRVVLLRAKNSTFKRPVTKLSMILPSDDEEPAQGVEKGTDPLLGGGMSEPQEQAPPGGGGKDQQIEDGPATSA